MEGREQPAFYVIRYFVSGRNMCIKAHLVTDYDDDIILFSNKNRGHAVAQLVEALCCKPEGRGFDSR
jgi:hypothetical protein